MTFSANDVVTVLTSFGVLSTIIGGLIVNIIMARKTQSQVKSVLEVNANQTNKLNGIEILVDGRYSDVLQELADVRKALADRTGLQIHIDSALRAQAKADEQESRVKEMKIQTQKVEIK